MSEQKQIFAEEYRFLRSRIDTYLTVGRPKVDVSQLTNEDLEIAHQYLLHRLEKESAFLLPLAKRRMVVMLKNTAKTVKRIADLLADVIEEERRRV